MLLCTTYCLNSHDYGRERSQLFGILRRIIGILKTQALRTAVLPTRQQNGARFARVYGEISAINCGLLRAGADCSERYFKNKDGELLFLDEICTVYCSHT